MMMPAANSEHRLLKPGLWRLLGAERPELPALAWSFTFFFAVLAAYYIVRPVRDEMGVLVGPGGLEGIYYYVFLVMLAAVPVFGKIVATFPRRLIVPTVYLFFVVNLVAFRIALLTGQTRALAIAFFVWGSVYNLFTISLFWSVMSEHWTGDQAKRLYGVIAAGGSIGGIAGPAIAQSLVRLTGPDNLLLISAAFLVFAIVAAFGVRRSFVGTAIEAGDRPPEGGLFDGAVQVWRSPFLFKIALVIFIANVVSTFFYQEQAAIVGHAIADRAARVQLFARMDLSVSVFTIALQAIGTTRILQRFGVGLSAAILPALAIVGFVLLAVAPVLSVIVGVVVAERVVAFALAVPAIRVLWTLVRPDEKYRAQNFVDTAVFRGGDAISGTLFNGMTLTAGLGAPGIAALSIPAALVWLWLTLQLGRTYDAQSDRK
jgi:ATP:ADP antiporter, AAA family